MRLVTADIQSARHESTARVSELLVAGHHDRCGR
jgi:hypothetical protein